MNYSPWWHHWKTTVDNFSIFPKKVWQNHTRLAFQSVYSELRRNVETGILDSGPGFRVRVRFFGYSRILGLSDRFRVSKKFGFGFRVAKLPVRVSRSVCLSVCFLVQFFSHFNFCISHFHLQLRRLFLYNVCCRQIVCFQISWKKCGYPLKPKTHHWRWSESFIRIIFSTSCFFDLSFWWESLSHYHFLGNLRRCSVYRILREKERIWRHLVLSFRHLPEHHCSKIHILDSKITFLFIFDIDHMVTFSQSIFFKLTI